MAYEADTTQDILKKAFNVTSDALRVLLIGGASLTIGNISLEGNPSGAPVDASSTYGLEVDITRLPANVSPNISSMQNDISVLQDDISLMQVDTSQIQVAISNIDQNISVAQNDISSIQNNISSVQTDISIMQNDVSIVAQAIVAHDAVDSGNPLKIGGVYKASPAAVASGDRAEVLMDAYGRIRTWMDSQLDPANDEVLLSGNDGIDGAGTNRTLKANSKGSLLKGRNGTEHTSTWTGNSSTKTAIATTFRLCEITAKYSGNVSNPLIVLLDSNVSAGYDVTLAYIDNSGIATSNRVVFDDSAIFKASDEIQVGVSVGANNAYVRIITEET